LPVRVWQGQRDVMNDTVVTEDLEQPAGAHERKARIADRDPGRRTSSGPADICSAKTGRTYDRSRPNRSKRQKSACHRGRPHMNESFVALFRAMKRLLTSDPKLREKSAHRHGAQLYPKLVPDQLSHHLARPQRERKFQLQRVLARHRIVNPLHLFAVELRWAPAQRLGFQTIPAALAIARQPAVDSGAIQVESLRQNFWAFTVLHTLDDAHPKLFESLVIKLAGVVLSHPKNESFLNGQGNINV